MYIAPKKYPIQINIPVEDCEYNEESNSVYVTLSCFPELKELEGRAFEIDADRLFNSCLNPDLNSFIPESADELFRVISNYDDDTGHVFFTDDDEFITASLIRNAFVLFNCTGGCDRCVLNPDATYEHDMIER